MRVWYLIQELQHLTFSPKKQSKHKCIFGRAQSAIFVDLLTAWQMCAWVKFWMFCRCHSRQAGLRTRVHNKRYWPLKRRFRSSVFCGREELLLVLTLTFFDSQDLLHSCGTWTTHKEKENKWNLRYYPFILQVPSAYITHIASQLLALRPKPSGRASSFKTNFPEVYIMKVAVQPWIMFTECWKPCKMIRFTIWSIWSDNTLKVESK